MKGFSPIPGGKIGRKPSNGFQSWNKPGLLGAAHGPLQPVAWVVPRRTAEMQLLAGALFLAFLVHSLILFTVIVMNARVREADYTFFTDVKLADHATVAVVAIKKPPPPPKTPPPPPKVEPQPRPVPQVQQPVPQPRPAAPAPAPRPAPRPAFAPRTVVNQAPGPPVVASTTGSGPPMQVGGGGGRPDGVPGGTGTGPGTGGDGTGGDGTGGNGTGGDGNGAQAPPGEEVWSVPEVEGGDNWQYPNPNANIANVSSWEEFCQLTGIPPSDVFGRATVQPILFDSKNPQKRITTPGVVRVQVKLTTKVGPPSYAAIVKSSGDQELDMVGQYIAQYSKWLPAMQNGHPVEITMEYTIRFASKSNPNPQFP